MIQLVRDGQYLVHRWLMTDSNGQFIAMINATVLLI